MALKTSAPAWHAGKYLKFERERTQPAIDLVLRIPLKNPRRILDMGCGPGNSTGVLLKRYATSSILGVDNSPEMLEKAKIACPQAEFRFFDANSPISQLGERFNLIFSNACIQWIPDHRRLIADLLSGLLPGSALAIQLPMQNRAPVHHMMQELSGNPEFLQYFQSEARQCNMLETAEYYDILATFNTDFSIWETAYCHQMNSHEAIVEWYGSTGLRPYLHALPKALRDSFKQQLLDKIKAFYPIRSDNSVMFRFERLFMVAVVQ